MENMDQKMLNDLDNTNTKSIENYVDSLDQEIANNGA